MNKIIPFPQIVDSLSELTGSSTTICETFIKELCSLISEKLSRGESVKIKHIGTFTPTGNNNEPILFIPDNIIADAINEPFAFFEPIELNDEVTEEILTLSDADNSQIDLSEKTSLDVGVVNTTEILDLEVGDEAQDDISEIEREKELQTSINNEENQNEISEDVSVEIEEANVILDEIEHEGDVESEFEEKEQQCTKSRVPIFFIGLFIGLAIGIAIGYYMHLSGLVSFFDKDAITVAVKKQPKTAQPKTIEECDTMQIIQPEVVYDTITSSRFLTTMSRKYYGDMNFWVYIYEENKAFLRDPDKIKPGTRVVIPPAQKYGINKNDSISVANARLKAVKIYEPYQK